jgi:hypothetical protein
LHDGKVSGSRRRARGGLKKREALRRAAHGRSFVVV